MERLCKVQTANLEAKIRQGVKDSFIVDKCYLKMPKGDRYVYRKKKKGKAFTGVQRYEKKAKEIAPDDAENSA